MQDIKQEDAKLLKCVQCAGDMTYYGNENFKAPFCDKPECPNFGLLQIGIRKE